MAWSSRQTLVAWGLAVAGTLRTAGSPPSGWAPPWPVVVGIALVALGMVVVLGVALAAVVILSSDQRSRNLARHLAIIRGRAVVEALATPPDPRCEPPSAPHDDSRRPRDRERTRTNRTNEIGGNR